MSLFLQDRTDAALILAIVLASGVLGFWQEHAATDAVAKLRALVETNARVLRDGEETIGPLADVVPGDVTLLSAGRSFPVTGICLKPASYSSTKPLSQVKHSQREERCPSL